MNSREQAQRQVLANIDAFVAKHRAANIQRRAANKAGVRAGVLRQPIGNFRVTPARITHRGMDITDVSDAAHKAVIRKAIDILHARQDGTLEILAGTTFKSVKANNTEGKWYGSATAEGKIIKLTQHMNELSEVDRVLVVLHEFAHLYLRHLDQPRNTPAERYEHERQADEMAMRWKWQ